MKGICGKSSEAVRICEQFSKKKSCVYSSYIQFGLTHTQNTFCFALSWPFFQSVSCSLLRITLSKT